MDEVKQMAKVSAWLNAQPNVGCGKPVLVLCDGKAIAGFENFDEAEQVRDMYARHATSSKSAAARNWTVTVR